MESSLIIVVAIVYFIVTVTITQFVTRLIVTYLFTAIKECAVDMKKKGLITDGDYQTFEALEYKRTILRIITLTLGIFEFLFFFCSVLIIVNFYHDPMSIMSGLLKLVGAWFAIKTLGNYQQWSNSIFGRAIFYNFVFGSMLNILLAIASGYGLFLLTLK